MKNQLHPLRSWLARRKQSVVEFAAQCGIPMRTLYDLTSPEVQDAKLTTLVAVEKATGGKITVQKMADWFKQRKN